MMAASWKIVAEMQARDLVRRRAALLLLAGLPLAWYLAEASTGMGYAVGTGVLAMSWSAAAAPLFAFLGARHADQRLVQAGLRTRDLVLGRLVALVGTGLVVALAFGVVMAVYSRPPRVGEMFLALVLTVLVSTPVGWLTASLVPRELEGTLLLIGLVGIQVSIPLTVPVWLIAYWSPLRLTDYDLPGIAPLWPTLHAVGWAGGLGLVAYALWRRRVCVQHLNKSV